jgi:hypothetical protein
MSVSLDQVLAVAAAGWVRLRDELRTILGADLTALWGYGARAFPDPPRLLGDVDTLAVLNRAPQEGIATLIRDTVELIRRDVGIALDTRFILLGDASRSELPRSALHADSSGDVSWAFLRAHFLAGHYVLLHGAKAEDIVPAPTWPELEAAFHAELEHLERHVAAGDDDPYEAAYAMLNGSRIVYGIETRNVVISKRAAGAWATRHLADRWHEAVRAAGRAYDGVATPEDIEVLRTAMPPFVAMVRQRLP